MLDISGLMACQQTGCSEEQSTAHSWALKERTGRKVGYNLWRNVKGNEMTMMGKKRHEKEINVWEGMTHDRLFDYGSKKESKADQGITFISLAT